MEEDATLDTNGSKKNSNFTNNETKEDTNSGKKMQKERKESLTSSTFNGREWSSFRTLMHNKVAYRHVKGS